MTTITAKAIVAKLNELEGLDQTEVHLQADYGTDAQPINQEWARYTPVLNILMVVKNDVAEQFPILGKFTVTFELDDPEKAEVIPADPTPGATDVTAPASSGPTTDAATAEPAPAAYTTTSATETAPAAAPTDVTPAPEAPAAADPSPAPGPTYTEGASSAPDAPATQPEPSSPATSAPTAAATEETAASDAPPAAVAAADPLAVAPATVVHP